MSTVKNIPAVRPSEGMTIFFRLFLTGVPDRVVEHGEQLELHHECGFDSEGIVEAVRQLKSTEVFAF